MLSINNIEDRDSMKKYYRTSDMLKLIEFFSEISPITDLVIVESIEDYENNKEYLDTFTCNRVDSLKGRKLVTVENSGVNSNYLSTLKQIKEKDPLGVLILFNTMTGNSLRYTRYAGIGIAVEVGKCVYIDAVGEGFDGREVSKGVCVHERYYIPWFELRRVSIENFHDYQIYQISNEEYKKSRIERLEFLNSFGVSKEEASKYIPENYKNIPDFIWIDVIKKVLKKLEKKEDLFINNNLNHIIIGGHTEGTEFVAWQITDQDRYTLMKKK